MEPRKGGARLILLTQWFEPEPAMRGLSFATELARRGFRVEVVTGFPNYPGGSVYAGYKIRPLQRERIGDVDVTRLALYPSHDSNRFGRILNYVSFFLSASFYLIFMARRADVVYVYHPPLTVGLAAALARLVRRMPVVLDVQDMWPDTLRATGMIGSERLLQVIDVFCRWTWRKVDRITVLSEGFRRLLLERDVPPEKVRIIYNWADETPKAEAPVESPAALADRGRLRVLFAGNIGAAQALDAVLVAAKLLGARQGNVDVFLLGSGIEEERLKCLADEMNLTNVHFLPRVPAGVVGAWLAAADCLLVHLRDDPLFAITIPSKTQAYMSAGKPVIMAVAGDAAELVRRSGGGVIVPPAQPEALADAIMALSRLPREELAELGKKSARFYSEHLSFSRGVDEFVALFEDVMAARGDRRA